MTIPDWIDDAIIYGKRGYGMSSYAMITTDELIKSWSNLLHITSWLVDNYPDVLREYSVYNNFKYWLENLEL